MPTISHLTYISATQQTMTLLPQWMSRVVLSSLSRHLLHHCFQALMDHGVKVASVLANSFSRRCSYIAESDAHVKEKAIQFGFVLGRWQGSKMNVERFHNHQYVCGVQVVLFSKLRQAAYVQYSMNWYDLPGGHILDCLPGSQTLKHIHLVFFLSSDCPIFKPCIQAIWAEITSQSYDQFVCVHALVRHLVVEEAGKKTKKNTHLSTYYWAGCWIK